MISEIQALRFICENNPNPVTKDQIAERFGVGMDEVVKVVAALVYQEMVLAAGPGGRYIFAIGPGQDAYMARNRMRTGRGW